MSAQGCLDELTGAYAIPVTAQDTTLSLLYQTIESHVVEKPFNELDVQSEYEGWGIGVRHPFILEPARSLYGSVRFENRRSKTFLLGEPFSFSRGVQDGESRVSVIPYSVSALMP